MNSTPETLDVRSWMSIAIAAVVMAAMIVAALVTSGPSFRPAGAMEMPAGQSDDAAEIIDALVVVRG